MTMNVSTSMTVTAMRRMILHDALRAAGHAGWPIAREEIARVSRVCRWRRDILDRAIRDLIDHGYAAELLDGRVLVHADRDDQLAAA